MLHYHIETHSGIRTLRPASGLQTYPLAIGNGVRFNMVVVNAMGFEPKPDPLYTPTQPCKVFRVTRFTVLPSTPRNLCNTLAGILHSLHHSKVLSARFRRSGATDATATERLYQACYPSPGPGH